MVLTDLPKDKVVYDKSHDSVMLKVRGYGFNLAKYYFETPSLKISVKKLKESNNTFLWNQKENLGINRNRDLKVKVEQIRFMKWELALASNNLSNWRYEE